MEFFNIQELLESRINFSQFDYKNMSIDEKEMLVSFFQGKIYKKNEYFDKMIKTQEYLSDKHILLHILYLLDHDEYEPIDIKKMIKKVKEMYIMTQNELVNEIEEMLLNTKIEVENKEKEELSLEQMINQYLNDIFSGIKMNDENGNLIIKEEKEKIYINKITDIQYEKLLCIFRESLKIKYSLNEFFRRYTEPMFNSQYVCENIIEDVINRLVKDDKISESLKKYSLQQVIDYINYVPNN